jgi:hypothetical protein
LKRADSRPSRYRGNVTDWLQYRRQQPLIC